MSKVNVGVGDEFPIHEVTGSGATPCGRVRAHWQARREARYERLRAWCAFWHGAPDKPAAPASSGDASYTDVPPLDKKDV
jgi:hypothetical protein